MGLMALLLSNIALYLLQSESYTVFGMDYTGSMYWGIVLSIAFIIIGLVVLNQLVKDILILKE